MQLKDLRDTYFNTKGKRTVPELTAAGWRIVQWGTDYADNHQRYPGCKGMLEGEIARTNKAIIWLSQNAGRRGEAWELYGLWLWIIRDPEVIHSFKQQFGHDEPADPFSS